MYVERDFPETYVNGFYEERAGGGFPLSKENFFLVARGDEALQSTHSVVAGACGTRGRCLTWDVGVARFSPTPATPDGQ